MVKFKIKKYIIFETEGVLCKGRLYFSFSGCSCLTINISTTFSRGPRAPAAREHAARVHEDMGGNGTMGAWAWANNRGRSTTQRRSRGVVIHRRLPHRFAELELFRTVFQSSRGAGGFREGTRPRTRLQLATSRVGSVVQS